MKSLKLILLGIFISVVLLTVTGCGLNFFPQPSTKWLFLVYLDGDNNLEPDAIKDFNEMELVGSTKDVTILALFDRTSDYDASNGDWKGTRLYKVTKDTDLNLIHSQLQITSPWGIGYNSVEADMSHPDTLRNFITYCQKHYPAEHTVLTLWNHGGGVYPKSLDSSQVRTDKRSAVFGMKSAATVTGKGLCWDDTTPGAWNCLTTDEVAKALSDARAQTRLKVDLVNMDACLMQMVEVAYEWRSETDYITGSEETVPADGNNYNTLLARLTGNPGMTVEEFSVALVDDYYAFYNGSPEDTTYSALKLGAPLDTFMSGFGALATKLKDTADRSGVYTAWNKTAFFYYPEISDLYDFTVKLIDESSDTQVVNAATNLKNAFNGFVINHHETGVHMSSSISPSYGLAFLMPTWKEWEVYSGNDQYVSLNLCNDTDWDEFVNQFVEYTSVLYDWSLDGSYTITLNGDGSFIASDNATGTWSLAGYQITWIKDGITYNGTVDFNGGTMSGTTAGGATSEDWNANRITI